MTASAHLRGHPIYWDSGNEIWRYLDTSEPTIENYKDRPCGYCGEHNTPEGHDACLGILPDVMNACCGHGEEWLAYVQFWDGSIVYVSAATRVIREKQRRRPNTQYTNNTKRTMTQKTIETIRPSGNTITLRNNVVSCRVKVFERPDGLIMLQPKSDRTGKNLTGHSRIIKRHEYDAAPADDHSRAIWALERCGLRVE